MTGVPAPCTDFVGAANLLRCTVHLVRHGQSTWNLEHRVQGHQSAPELTDLGRRQASAAAAVFAASRVTRLLTSDLTRAVQSAEIIGAATGLVPIASTLLREQSLGSLEGATHAEAAAAFAGVDLSDPETPYGDGESRRDVLSRFRELMSSDLVTEVAPEGGIIMVSHGDTIRIAVAHLLGEDPVTGPWRTIDNGSVVTVRPPVP
jgi:probable phosphoglycerate mutase